MNGPDCPIHQTPMDWLSTWNQWQYYCKACDTRYNEALRPMSEPCWCAAEGRERCSKHKNGPDLQKP